MVFVLNSLLFDAIFSRFLGSDMVQIGSINAPTYVFSRIFMQLESKKHVFSCDFGLQISPGSLLGLFRFTHAKNTYFLVYFCVIFLGQIVGTIFWANICAKYFGQILFFLIRGPFVVCWRTWAPRIIRLLRLLKLVRIIRGSRLVNRCALAKHNCPSE